MTINPELVFCAYLNLEEAIYFLNLFAILNSAHKIIVNMVVNSCENYAYFITFTSRKK